MSSNEDEYNDGESSFSTAQGMKKRRIQRACDICRRKKIRCTVRIVVLRGSTFENICFIGDGVQMPGNRCSNCIAYSFECTYVEAAKKRGPPKGYVEGLENRLEKLEKLLRRLCPDENFLKELNSNLDQDLWALERAPPLNPSTLVSCAGPSRSPSSAQLAHPDPRDIITSAIRNVGTTPDSRYGLPDDEDEDLQHAILTDNLKRLSLQPDEYRFFGKSSGAMLIQTAIDLKNEYTGKSGLRDQKRPMLGSSRPEFWLKRPWECSSNEHQPTTYEFPEEDLIQDLANLYFDHVNLYLPLLHRPTFDGYVAEGLHHKNDGFGAVLLLVCAVAARFSDDPRVLLEGVESSHSSGWKWFDQVQMVSKSLLSPPSLFDLQFYCLSVQYLQGTSAPQACWTMVGIGIRLAQDVGAHRRKAHDRGLSVEDELWKRAFWILICMDRMVSAALGRPCAIHDEDYDLDPPVECDDEYWEHPDVEQRFKQPPGKPCLITAFCLYLKLNQVLAFSLRTIYSINKSKILLGFVGPQWEQHIVAELDSALNKWVDSVPDHLRWDPTREDLKFFNQSVLLYASYYQIQILIHRPFIPSPSKPSPLSFPSLAICTNAARSCSHVVDIQRKRNTHLPPQIQVGRDESSQPLGGGCLKLPFPVQMAVFTSGIVLLLSIWGGKRSGLSTDPKKEVAEVHKCMQVLRSLETRWHSAGRLWDILYELASVGELPLPQPSPPTQNKRERDADSPISSATSGTPMPPSFDGPRNIAGSKRVQKDSPMPSTDPNPARAAQQQSMSQHCSEPSGLMPKHEDTQMPPTLQQQLFTLPVYSNELGSLPLHGQVKFSPQGQSPLDGSNYWYAPVPGVNDGIGHAMDGGLSSSQSHAPRHPQVDTFPQSDLGNTPQVYPMDASGMMFEPMTMGFSGPSFTGSSMDGITPGSLYRNAGGVGHGMPSVEQQHQRQPMGFAVPPQQQGYVDSDTIAMWSTAPSGFELDEWGTYLTNVSEITQGHHAGSGVGDVHTQGLGQGHGQ
ncbi:fungal-specific transcription factor domain-containing protein [Crucibulum laeve]|uniref:Fungal-specific transcription factor domain-containing protein n=1 Tax=Crucibulum laeve TaxID=68775 RepID=A0A5C3LXX4_9AGAR|nr:fungal-specific transcription factor domain-containing protein [Crucibulum laeve]